MDAARRILILTAVLLSTWKMMTYKWQDTAINEAGDEEQGFKPRPVKQGSVAQRTPASTTVAPRSAPSEYYQSPRNAGNVLDKNPWDTQEGSEASESPESGGGYAGNNNYVLNNGGNNNTGRSSSSSDSSSKSGTSGGDASSSAPGGGGFGGGIIGGGGRSNDPNNPGGGGSGGDGTDPVQPTKRFDTPICSASAGSGSYNQPISVSLTCSTASHIRYCISEGSCCDPETGLTYSTPVAVGQAPRTYCMSFMGTAREGGLRSPIVEMMYTFNPDFPNLEVTPSKLSYQTTQLSGVLSLGSDDFGSSKHKIGVLNLKTNDPIIQNLNCEQVLQKHTANEFTPAASVILPEAGVTTISPSSLINLLLNTPAHLLYGSNHVFSYMKDTTYQEHQYACQTHDITLEDFAYFQTEPINVQNEDGVAIFTGGFNSFHFFESLPEVEPGVISRGPAGSSVVTDDNQQLRVGLLSLFYQN
jgi:hypothetical protein